MLSIAKHTSYIMSQNNETTTLFYDKETLSIKKIQ